MLCITLKDGQRFEIRHGGESMTVKVKEHKRSTRIFLDAPHSFRIVRDDATHKRTDPPEPGRAA